MGPVDGTQFDAFLALTFLRMTHQYGGISVSSILIDQQLTVVNDDSKQE